MNLTIKSGMKITISDISPDECKALISMIRGAGLEERRQWFPTLEALTKTPLDKLERDNSDQLKMLVKDVKRMRRAQKASLRDRSLENIRLSMDLEKKVDDMVYNILNRK